MGNSIPGCSSSSSSSSNINPTDCSSSSKDKNIVIINNSTSASLKHKNRDMSPEVTLEHDLPLPLDQNTGETKGESRSMSRNTSSSSTSSKVMKCGGWIQIKVLMQNLFNRIIVVFPLKQQQPPNSIESTAAEDDDERRIMRKMTSSISCYDLKGITESDNVQSVIDRQQQQNNTVYPYGISTVSGALDCRVFRQLRDNSPAFIDDEVEDGEEEDLVIYDEVAPDETSISISSCSNPSSSSTNQTVKDVSQTIQPDILADTTNTTVSVMQTRRASAAAAAGNAGESVTTNGVTAGEGAVSSIATTTRTTTADDLLFKNSIGRRHDDDNISCSSSSSSVTTPPSSSLSSVSPKIQTSVNPKFEANLLFRLSSFPLQNKPHSYSTTTENAVISSRRASDNPVHHQPHYANIVNARPPPTRPAPPIPSIVVGHHNDEEGHGHGHHNHKDERKEKMSVNVTNTNNNRMNNKNSHKTAVVHPMNLEQHQQMHNNCMNGEKRTAVITRSHHHHNHSHDDCSSSSSCCSSTSSSSSSASSSCGTNTNTNTSSVVQASTSDLLRSLTSFLEHKFIFPIIHNPNQTHSNGISINSRLHGHSSSPSANQMYCPGEVMTWLRTVDRSLLVQGWQDIAFISPSNVVFLFLLIKESMNNASSFTSIPSIKQHIMSCLYLAYAYEGNEISYPLKPFLTSGDSRAKFFARTVAIMNICSKKMLDINRDANMFASTFTSLLASGSPSAHRHSNATSNGNAVRTSAARIAWTPTLKPMATTAEHSNSKSSSNNHHHSHHHHHDCQKKNVNKCHHSSSCSSSSSGSSTGSSCSSISPSRSSSCHLRENPLLLPVPVELPPAPIIENSNISGNGNKKRGIHSLQNTMSNGVSSLVSSLFSLTTSSSSSNGGSNQMRSSAAVENENKSKDNNKQASSVRPFAHHFMNGLHMKDNVVVPITSRDISDCNSRNNSKPASAANNTSSSLVPPILLPILRPRVPQSNHPHHSDVVIANSSSSSGSSSSSNNNSSTRIEYNNCNSIRNPSSSYSSSLMRINPILESSSSSQTTANAGLNSITNMISNNNSSNSGSSMMTSSSVVVGMTTSGKPVVVNTSNSAAIPSSSRSSFSAAASSSAAAAAIRIVT